MLTREIYESTGSKLTYHSFKLVCLSFVFPKKGLLATHRRGVIMPISMSLLLRLGSFCWVAEKWTICEEKAMWTSTCNVHIFRHSRVIKSFERAAFDVTRNGALHVQILIQCYSFVLIVTDELHIRLKTTALLLG